MHRVPPPRILHAIHSVDPAHGGPVEGIGQLARATAARLEHRIVSVDDPAAPFVAGSPIPVTALGPAGRLGYSPRLVPWLRSHGRHFDAVVVHGLWRYVSVGAGRVLRETGVPYFAFPHGMLDPWFKRRYPVKHLKKLFFWPWTEYRLLRDAKAVIFTCDEERLRARQSFRLYRANEEIAVLGIEGPAGDPLAQREAFLTRFPALRDKRLLLYLSRIHPKKGCDLLITAFARRAARDERAHLVMAGPDQADWGRELRAAAAGLGIAARITWTGMLTGELKWGAFHSAEAFILPSHQENFGIVVAEALACGVPVLISDQVQIWREIEAAAAGFVATDDLQGTEVLIARWLDATADDWLARRRHARECFHSRFEIGAYARRFTELVEHYCAASAKAAAR